MRLLYTEVVGGKMFKYIKELEAVLEAAKAGNEDPFNVLEYRTPYRDWSEAAFMGSHPSCQEEYRIKPQKVMKWKWAFSGYNRNDVSISDGYYTENEANKQFLKLFGRLEGSGKEFDE